MSVAEMSPLVAGKSPLPGVTNNVTPGTTTAVDDWVIRRAVPEDEGGIVPLWLRALRWSYVAVDAGFPQSRQVGSDDQLAWWKLNHPIVTALVRTADVTVLCDPERSTNEPGAPAIIWAWLVTAGDVVYGCGVKNSIRDAGMGREVAHALLGDRLARPQVQAMDLIDLHRLKLVPSSWTVDPTWWEAMRFLSKIALSGDRQTARVVEHIFDPSREQWLPTHMRAA